jgi:hypothetical protein
LNPKVSKTRKQQNPLKQIFLIKKQEKQAKSSTKNKLKKLRDKVFLKV